MDRKRRILGNGVISYFYIIEVFVSPLRAFYGLLATFSHRSRGATLFRSLWDFWRMQKLKEKLNFRVLRVLDMSKV
jgi:hypothetical protein